MKDSILSEIKGSTEEFNQEVNAFFDECRTNPDNDTSIIKKNIKKFIDEYKKDINEIKDMDGNNLLHLAVDLDNFDLITWLLEKNINVLASNTSDLEAAYDYAINRSNNKILKSILAHVVDLVYPKFDKNGPYFPVIKTLLKTIRKKDENEKSVPTFLEEKKINSFSTPDDLSLLQMCILPKAIKVRKFYGLEKEAFYIKILVVLGADTTLENSFGETPLHYAALRENPDIIAALGENALSRINHQDKDGYTPLLRAVKFAPVENFYVVKYLVERGADISVKDQQGSTLLHAAAIRGFWNIFHYLTSKLDINQLDHQGQTAIALAREIYESLKSKPNPNQQQLLYLQNIIHFDAYKKFTSVRKKFTTDLRKISDFFHDAQIDCNTTLPLIRNTIDSNGNSLLHFILLHLELESFEKLLSYFRDLINHANLMGNTPLHTILYILEEGPKLTRELNLRKLNLLLQYGASKSIMTANRAGITPLHLFARCNFDVSAIQKMTNISLTRTDIEKTFFDVNSVPEIPCQLTSIFEKEGHHTVTLTVDVPETNIPARKIILLVTSMREQTRQVLKQFISTLRPKDRICIVCPDIHMNQANPFVWATVEQREKLQNTIETWNNSDGIKMNHAANYSLSIISNLLQTEYSRTSTEQKDSDIFQHTIVMQLYDWHQQQYDIQQIQLINNPNRVKEYGSLFDHIRLHIIHVPIEEKEYKRYDLYRIDRIYVEQVSLSEFEDSFHRILNNILSTNLQPLHFKFIYQDTVFFSNPIDVKVRVLHDNINSPQQYMAEIEFNDVRPGKLNYLFNVPRESLPNLKIFFNDTQLSLQSLTKSSGMTRNLASLETIWDMGLEINASKWANQLFDFSISKIIYFYQHLEKNVEPHTRRDHLQEKIRVFLIRIFNSFHAFVQTMVITIDKKNKFMELFISMNATQKEIPSLLKMPDFNATYQSVSDTLCTLLTAEIDYYAYNQMQLQCLRAEMRLVQKNVVDTFKIQKLENSISYLLLQTKQQTNGNIYQEGISGLNSQSGTIAQPQIEVSYPKTTFSLINISEFTDFFNKKLTESPAIVELALPASLGAQEIKSQSQLPPRTIEYNPKTKTPAGLSKVFRQIDTTVYIKQYLTDQDWGRLKIGLFANKDQEIAKILNYTHLQCIPKKYFADLKSLHHLLREPNFRFLEINQKVSDWISVFLQNKKSYEDLLNTTADENFFFVYLIEVYSTSYQKVTEDKVAFHYHGNNYHVGSLNNNFLITALSCFNSPDDQNTTINGGYSMNFLTALNAFLKEINIKTQLNIAQKLNKSTLNAIINDIKKKIPIEAWIQISYSGLITLCGRSIVDFICKAERKFLSAKSFQNDYHEWRLYNILLMAAEHIMKANAVSLKNNPFADKNTQHLNALIHAACSQGLPRFIKILSKKIDFNVRISYTDYVPDEPAPQKIPFIPKDIAHRRVRGLLDEIDKKKHTPKGDSSTPSTRPAPRH